MKLHEAIESVPAKKLNQYVFRNGTRSFRFSGKDGKFSRLFYDDKTLESAILFSDDFSSNGWTVTELE